MADKPHVNWLGYARLRFYQQRDIRGEAVLQYNVTCVTELIDIKSKLIKVTRSRSNRLSVVF